MNVHRLWPVVVMCLVAACAPSHSEEPAVLSVFAAASLTEAFEEAAERFEREHGVAVELSFGGSFALAQQIIAGAPADVFVAADEVSMQRAAAAGAVGDPTVIARNRLTILVERGNPLGIASLRDLGRGDLVVVLCRPEVPCGRLARSALDRTGTSVEADSLEQSVKGVVAKVVLGEADAGVVYATDALAAGDAATAVAIDPVADARTAYPAAVVTGTDQRDAARAWIEFVDDGPGADVLARHGFLPG